MIIDTYHEGINQRVVLKAETDAERELTDNQILRVAGHQHLLVWDRVHGSGKAEITPRTMRASTPRGTVTREGDDFTVLFTI